MFDLINVFEVFLPQLLRYPNPSDPLNGEAAALLMRDPRSYETKVKGTHPVLGPLHPTNLLTCLSRCHPFTMATIHLYVQIM